MPPSNLGTFLDRSLVDLDAERKSAWRALEIAYQERGSGSLAFTEAFELWHAVHRLWWDTWEAAWRSYQVHHRRSHRGTPGWARPRAMVGTDRERSLKIAPASSPGNPPASPR
jgi:hypothetical protein